MPPVSRLTIGTHHLEYGFPSTHSTNSISFAMYLYILLRTASLDADSAFSSPINYALSVTGLLLYSLSIVLGRLYCGMHSFTDCFVGCLVGASIGAIQGVYGPEIESIISNSSWMLPVSLSLLCLLLVNQHPQPVDDCPCFEDAIASLALLTGTCISRWHASQVGMDVPSGFYTSRTPGWENVTWEDTITWWLFAVMKMVTGVSAIFAWRLAVKQLMHAALPPLIRWASGLVGNIGWTLPNRRWYTPATHYSSRPIEKGLHPIPSSMNLSAELANRGEEASTTSRLPHARLYNGGQNVKSRKGNGVSEKRVEFVGHKGEKLKDEEEENIKRYDADGRPVGRFCFF